MALFPIAVASARDFPTKPITLVVPFSPGGATDTIGRLVGKGMGDHLGQTVVVENKPGAGTIIGASAVARSAPDGYTLLISSGTTFTVNPAVHSDLPYDPIKSFEPIGMIGRTPMVLLANPDVPVTTFKELVAAAKASPGKFTYGSYGMGTTAHFAGEMMQHMAMNDLIGGQIPLAVDTLTGALPQIKAGKVRPIAVTTANRSPMAPDVPSIAESGYEAMNADTWVAIVAPNGLPDDVQARLEKALADTLADPEISNRLSAAGTEPATGSSADVAKQIAQELPLMKEVAERANIKLD
jgi:tripartite-type tricarboxylate transporter receptor subunit TctC